MQRKRLQLSGKAAGLLGGSAAGFGIGAFAGFLAEFAVYLLGGGSTPALPFYGALIFAALGGCVGYFYWVRMLARRN